MLTLGIDLGTTKVAAVLYDTENPEAGCAVSAEHHAASSGAPGSAEQNAETMYDAVLRLLAELPSQKLMQVKAIGLTGQMHSVVLWNNSEVSPIVTWLDKRASAAGHLEEFRSLSGRPLSDGFGAATLAELARQKGLKQWQYAASPADWQAVRLTGIPEPVMDPTFAASWGIYDSGSGVWDYEAAAALNIPEYLLPRIVPSGSMVGRTRNVPGIPDGIPVIAPFGIIRHPYSAQHRNWSRNFS